MRRSARVSLPYLTAPAVPSSIPSIGIRRSTFRRFSRCESAGSTDRLGPGCNIGLTPGFQTLLARRLGMITQLGWLRTQRNFSGGDQALDQGVWPIGFVF